MILDFTTTAMCRPDIYRRTLESFRQNLRGVSMRDCVLHLNIDPVPADVGHFDTEFEALEVFSDMRGNIPQQDSFPAAVKWCWSQPSTEYFFHLEDDWLLTKPVNIAAMVDLLDANPDLSCVNLRAYNWPPDESRICLSPCLMRASHAKIMAERMTLDANPEQQLRPVTDKNPCGGRHEGFRSVQFGDGIVLKDIGREWLDRSGFKKEKPVSWVKWVPQHEEAFR